MQTTVYDLIFIRKAISNAEERNKSGIQCENCEKLAIRTIPSTYDDPDDSGSDMGESWSFCFDHLDKNEQREFLEQYKNSLENKE